MNDNRRRRHITFPHGGFDLSINMKSRGAAHDATEHTRPCGDGATEIHYVNS